MAPFVVAQRSVLPVAVLVGIAVMVVGVRFAAAGRLAAAEPGLELASGRRKPPAPAASTADSGHVAVSGRGHDLLRVASERRIACEEGDEEACATLRELALHMLQAPNRGHAHAFATGEE